MSFSNHLKYVRHSQVGFVLWPRTLKLFHVHVGKMLEQNPECKSGRIISAGFAVLTPEGEVTCFGKSESLGLEAAPDDTAALAAQLGLKPGKGFYR